jgi:hypothetical protein
MASGGEVVAAAAIIGRAIATDKAVPTAWFLNVMMRVAFASIGHRKLRPVLNVHHCSGAYAGKR